MSMYFHFSWKMPKSRRVDYMTGVCVCNFFLFFVFLVNQVLLFTGSFLSCKQSVPIFPYSVWAATIRQTESARTLFFLHFWETLATDSSV